MNNIENLRASNKWKPSLQIKRIQPIKSTRTASLSVANKLALLKIKSCLLIKAAIIDETKTLTFEQQRRHKPTKELIAVIH